ncbi:MAG: DUF4139 domain-containing protein [Haliscomenobacteraceae bacterium CHB4]|nr:DUF4139 domain-containing protein [Haliscomenobacteraceae bacterium CHB4]
MKKHLLLHLFLGFALVLNAQNLSVKTVTIFKNGKSLISKSGKVPVSNSRYSMTELPAALFGTYWVTGAEVASVFAALDSVDAADSYLSTADVLRKNLGKQVVLYLHVPNQANDMVVIGTVERIFNDREFGQESLLVKVKDGGWATVNVSQIRRYDFSEMPDMNITAKKARKHLDLNFKTTKTEQEIGLSYLVNKLGWMPVYRLELNDKTKGRLSLRAEIANDAEDLGDAELRLAVGIPNFAFATRLSQLVDFGREVSPQDYGYRGNLFNPSSNAYQVSLDAETYEERVVVSTEEQVDGSQAEDFYFYTIRPGNFPKNSRYQHPVFETDIQPSHFFECTLPTTSAKRKGYYQEPGRNGIEEKIPVTHYVEFKNTTTYPWTTGAANLLSQSAAGLQPLSQDMLPYTAPGATCKVKIAQTPEIKVTHGEGDVDRQENAKKFFSTTYDKVKIEAQVLAVNYKTEPVKLKICRDIEGTPLSSEQKWTTRQEQATLRVNPSHSLEWVIELKPGEERKWMYSYEVFVNM